MFKVEIILPERVLDRVADGLIELTERIHALNPDIVAHGFLGGQHGYGAQWDNDTFQMRPYCWCEREDCAWCGGCNCEDNAFEYYIDGKRVSDKEHREWFLGYAGKTPHEIGQKFGTAAYRKYDKMWNSKIDERNKRSNIVHHPNCDYCAGKGIFSTHGAAPGRGAPNFWHKPSGFKVWWYKYIGRGMETQGEPRPGTIAECIASLTAQGIEARSDETQSGSAEGESPSAEGGAP